MDPNNDIDWTNRFGGTSSPQTGPSGAFDGSYYMYTEASGNGNGYPNMEAIMYVECVDPTQWTELSLAFAYHMYGATMGTLSIEVSPDSGTTWIQEWSLSGNQGNQWLEASIDLSTFNSTELKIRIRVTTGNTAKSDVAIDKLSILGGPLTAEGNFLTNVANDGIHNITYSIQGCNEMMNITINEINQRYCCF